MTYEQSVQFAQTWGLVILVALSVLVAAYALWPGNQAKFDRAARAPLQEDDQDV